MSLFKPYISYMSVSVKKEERENAEAEKTR